MLRPSSPFIYKKGAIGAMAGSTAQPKFIPGDMISSYMYPTGLLSVHFDTSLLIISFLVITTIGGLENMTQKDLEIFGSAQQISVSITSSFSLPSNILTYFLSPTCYKPTLTNSSPTSAYSNIVTLLLFAFIRPSFIMFTRRISRNKSPIVHKKCR